MGRILNSSLNTSAFKVVISNDKKKSFLNNETPSCKFLQVYQTFVYYTKFFILEWPFEYHHVKSRTSSNQNSSSSKSQLSFADSLNPQINFVSSLIVLSISLMIFYPWNNIFLLIIFAIGLLQSFSEARIRVVWERYCSKIRMNTSGESDIPSLLHNLLNKFAHFLASCFQRHTMTKAWFDLDESLLFYNFMRNSNCCHASQFFNQEPHQKVINSTSSLSRFPR